MLKIIPNPDEEMYIAVTEAVKKNDGYCCCRIAKNKDTKCMCKEFKDQQFTGLCYCERFMKVEVDNEI